MKVTINRRSIVGFGYTAGCVQGDYGLEVESVNKPDYTGTIKQVCEKLDHDNTLNSFRSGGTCYNTAWFIKSGKQWLKIKHDQYLHPRDLLEKIEDYDRCTGKTSRFCYNKIELEIN